MYFKFFSLLRNLQSMRYVSTVKFYLYLWSEENVLFYKSMIELETRKYLSGGTLYAFSSLNGLQMINTKATYERTEFYIISFIARFRYFGYSYREANKGTDGSLRQGRTTKTLSARNKVQVPTLSCITFTGNIGFMFLNQWIPGALYFVSLKNIVVSSINQTHILICFVENCFRVDIKDCHHFLKISRNIFLSRVLPNNDWRFLKYRFTLSIVEIHAKYFQRRPDFDYLPASQRMDSSAPWRLGSFLM